MSTFNWIPFLTYAVITAFTPGPNNLMSMTNGAKQGFRKALPFNYGIFTGQLILQMLCTIFCSTLEVWIPKIRIPMLIIGAAYLLYLAWGIFCSGDELEHSEEKTGYFTGLLLQFVNIKIYLYFIMSMEAYVIPHYQGQWGMLLFFSILLPVIAFISTLCWSAFGSVFRQLFTTHAKVTNTIMALLLVCCAVSLFL